MVIVSTTLVVAVLSLVGIAAVAGVALLGALALDRLAFHHRARLSRHESVGTYYRHAALGH